MRLESEDANGTFQWKDETIRPGVGDHLFLFAYVPNDTDNYDYAGVALECEMDVRVNPKHLADESGTVASIPDQSYTGKAVTPTVTVRDSQTGKTLVPDVDYTVAYTNNVETGTASVVLTGRGNYTGAMEVTFRIVEAPQDAEKDDPADAERIEEAQQTAEKDVYKRQAQYNARRRRPLDED